MNKPTQLSLRASFEDFASKLTGRWRQSILASEPARSPLGKNAEEILRDLVSMPTTSGNYAASHEALDYIAVALTTCGMHVARHEWNGVESLVATSRPTKTPLVFLVAHLDVVAGAPELFELRVRDDRYFGRGVLDMKGALAAYLATVQHLQSPLADYDFGIMVTTDEEIGGFDGAQRLAEAGYLSKIMILPDGGANNWDLEQRCKGIWWITLEATGKDAHGSRPWEGKNAIEAVMATVEEIKALFPQQGPDTSTISLGVVQGGKTINQIPATATASLDIRFINKAEQARLYHRIQAIAATHGMKLTTEVEAAPVENDITNPFLKAYKACVEETIGRPIGWVTSNAGNDGRFFIERGAQCAIGYPTGGNHHGTEEWIAKDSLTQMEMVFTKYLEGQALVKK